MAQLAGALVFVPGAFTLHPPGYSTWKRYGMDGIHKIGYGFHGIGDGFHLHSMVIPPSFHGHSIFISLSFHGHSNLIPPSFHMESRFNNLFYMQFSINYTYSVMDSIGIPYEFHMESL